MRKYMETFFWLVMGLVLGFIMLVMFLALLDDWSKRFSKWIQKKRQEAIKTRSVIRFFI